MRSRARTWALVIGCSIAAVLLLTATIAAAWVDRVLLDEDRFSSRVSSTLESDVVSEYLAIELTDQLLLRAPDLITVRPALEIVLQDAVRSRTAIGGVRTAVREAHRAIVAGVPAEAIVLDLRAARSLADLLLRESAPSVAARLPRDIDSARIDGALVGLRTDVFERAEQLQRVIPVLVVGSMLTLAFTVVVAPSRHSGAFAAGAVLAAAGALGVAIQRLAGLLLASFLPRPEEATPAVSIVWRAVMQDYQTWNIGLVAVGLVIAAAAVALGRVPARADVRPYLLQSAWARAIGGATATTIGLALVRWPLPTLNVLLLAAGAILAAVGVALLFRSVLYGIRHAREAAASSSYRWLRLRPSLFASATVVAVVVVLGAWFWNALREPPPEPFVPPVEICNGFPQLCDRPLNEVVFAGTHNSMAAAAERGWYFPQQRGGIAEQLRAGIRVFLIDTYYGQQTSRGVRTVRDDGLQREELIEQHGIEVVEAAERVAARLLPGGVPGIFLCHSYCELGATALRAALADLRDFLDAQPGSFVVLFIQDQTEPDDTIEEFQRAGLGERAYTHEVGDPWPTLGELLQSGKQLLVLVENDAGGSEGWYQHAWTLVQDTPFDVTSIDDLGCQPNRGSEEAPLFLLNHWVGGNPATPAFALETNTYEAIMRHVDLCEAERGRIPNFIAVDFYDSGDLFEVVNELNGIEP